MITAGIDCGAKNTKTIIMKDDQILGKGSVLTGFDQEKAVEKSLGKALRKRPFQETKLKRSGEPDRARLPFLLPTSR